MAPLGWLHVLAGGILGALAGFVAQKIWTKVPSNAIDQ
jgi:hypothetical protein